jgi:dynein heavy chain 2
MTAGNYHKLVQDKLAAFGREFKDLSIFLFSEILERIAAMERVLTRPGGCLLLLGRSGVGRRSCTRLVSDPNESTFERFDLKSGVSPRRNAVDLSKRRKDWNSRNLNIDASIYSCEGLKADLLA